MVIKPCRGVFLSYISHGVRSYIFLAKSYIAPVGAVIFLLTPKVILRRLAQLYFSCEKLYCDGWRSYIFANRKSYIYHGAKKRFKVFITSRRQDYAQPFFCRARRMLGA